jgi:glycosyltransferase involved in cell wall biosynthesis
VLFLAESFWPVLGGGEQHIRQLATALVARGMTCTVLTRRGQDDWPADEVLDGVRVLRVGPSGPARTGKYLMVLPAMWRLARARRHFDVVVVRGTRVLGLPGLMAARLARRAIVLQAEVSGEMSGEIYTWGTRFDRSPLKRVVRAGVALRNLLLRDADAFVTISKRTQAEFLDAGLPPRKVSQLPHGIDTQRFRPASAEERSALRAQLGLPAEALLIVFTGRLLKGKGIETLLTAFKRLASDDARLHLAIVGSGADQALSIEADLRDFVERSGLGQCVTFAGRVENVPDWLRAADIYGFPSFFEAMPLSILEAAACGLPAATTRIGGIVDVIDDDVSGLLIEPGDVDGLTSALGRLIRDPQLRQRLGAAARLKIVEHFGFDHNVERYRALFNSLCRRTTPGPGTKR